MSGIPRRDGLPYRRGMTEATAPGTTRRIAAAYRDVVTARTWKGTAHLVLDLWVGIVTFTITFTLLVTTVSLVIVFPLAVVLAWITEWVVRLLGRFERYRVAAFLDVDLPDPHRGRPAGNWWRRFVTRLRSGALWRELAHHLVLLPQGILFFCVVVAAWSVALTALTLPATIWAIPDHQVYVWSGVAVHGWVAGALGALAGLVLLPLVPFVVRGLVEAEVALARLLLGPSRSEALEGRVSQLTETRSRVVDAAEAERRRIERDLHDGAQQRLVALAMDLGLAQEKFDTDPEGARALVDDAHARGQAGARRAARPGPRHPPGGPHRPGPRRRPDRGGRTLTGAGAAQHRRRRAARPDHRGHRLLRRVRGPHQRGQARRRPPGRGHRRPPGHAAPRGGHRRRPRRRRRGHRQRAGRPARPGRRASTAGCTSAARSADRPLSWWSSRAHRDRRGRRAPPRRAHPVAHRRRRGGRGRRGRSPMALLDAVARQHPDLCIIDVRMPPDVHRRRHPGRAARSGADFPGAAVLVLSPVRRAAATRPTCWRATPTRSATS